MVYNTHRPHDALNLDVPASRYRASDRRYPETLPSLEYTPDVLVRRASTRGVIKFESGAIRAGVAFASQPLGVRVTLINGVYEVLCAHQVVGQFDLSLTPRGGSREKSTCVRSVRVAHSGVISHGFPHTSFFLLQTVTYVPERLLPLFPAQSAPRDEPSGQTRGYFLEAV